MTMDAGGTWEGPVRFPEDHPDEAKRGTSRRVKVELKEVKRQELPELTDEFAKEMGDFESVAALKGAVRADLEAEAGREADAKVRAELIEQLGAANNISVPPSLLERAIHAYMHAYSVPEEQHGRFHQEFRPVAEAQVRRDRASRRSRKTSSAGSRKSPRGAVRSPAPCAPRSRRPVGCAKSSAA
jgi:trigger factor